MKNNYVYRTKMDFHKRFLESLLDVIFSCLRIMRHNYNIPTYTPNEIH